MGELAPARLRHRRAGHFEPDRGTLGGGGGQAVHQCLFAAGEARGAAPAARRARDQNRVLDLTDGELARPIHARRDDPNALEPDRAILADPFLEKPFSQSGSPPP